MNGATPPPARERGRPRAPDPPLRTRSHIAKHHGHMYLPWHAPRGGQTVRIRQGLRRLIRGSRVTAGLCIGAVLAASFAWLPPTSAQALGGSCTTGAVQTHTGYWNGYA